MSIDLKFQRLQLIAVYLEALLLYSSLGRENMENFKTKSFASLDDRETSIDAMLKELKKNPILITKEQIKGNAFSGSLS